MLPSPRFIVVDDDKFNNALCGMVISRIFKFSDILTFEDSIKGLKYMVDLYLDTTVRKHDVLLLDINMPDINGWQFLDQFNKEVEDNGVELNGQLTIYVLSSSVDMKDINRALAYKNVRDYIIKPITREMVVKLANDLGIVDAG